MEAKEYILVGKIVNTHGIKGEVKVLSQTDFKDDRYHKDNKAYIDMDGEKIFVTIQKYRIHQGFDLLTFENMDDINVVEKFKGKDLYSENKNPQLLQADEYQQTALINMAVWQNDILIGNVENIRTYPQCDYLVIKKNDGSQALIPFLKAFIINVDMKLNRIDIIEMEGLL